MSSILHREDVHLIDYLRVLSQRRFFIVIVLVVAMLSTLWATFTTTELYASRARILIDSVNTLVEFPGVERHRRLRMDTEMHLMRSLEVAEHAVATRLRPDLDRSEPEFLALVNRVRAATKVKVVKNTLIVELSVMADHPKVAAEWANAMAEAYVELNFEDTKRANAAGTAAMLQEITKTTLELETDERKLIKFKAENNIVSSAGKKAAQNTAMGTGTVKLAQTEVKLIDAEQTYQALKAWQKKNNTALPLPPAMAPSPLVIDLYAKIAEYRSDLKAMKLKYRERHPKVQALAARLRTAESSFNREIRNAMLVLEQEIKLHTAVGSRTEASLASTREGFIEDNERDWQYRVLQRNVDVKEDIYKALLTRLGDLNIAKSIVRNNVRFVERAVPVPIAIHPNKKFNMLVGLIFGLAVAIVGVFFLEYLDNTMKTPDDVSRYLELPVLAVVPMARAELLRTPYEPPRLRDGDVSGETAA